MIASERALNLARSFNVREGFTTLDDTLPERLFEEMSVGSRKGSKIHSEELHDALRMYYKMMGWDRTTGIPTAGKLHQLDLGWAVEQMANPKHSD